MVIFIMNSSNSNSQLDLTEYDSMLNNVDDSLLSQEEEIEYFKKIEKGDLKARQEFIEHNLLLVVSIAREFRNENRRKLLTMEDLIQEGNASLCAVIDKFDYRKGCKFSTYAVDWIKQGMERAIDEKGRTIRVPPSRLNVIKQYKNRESELKAKLDREPTFDEVMKLLPYTSDFVKYCLKLGYEPLSLSYQQEDHDYNLNNILSDQNMLEESTEDQINEDLTASEIRKLVNKVLSGDDLTIIKMLFGLSDNGKTYSFEEIADKLNLNTNQVKVKEHHALQILKHYITAHYKNIEL